MSHPGELKCEIPIIISNHPDLEGVAASFGIPFRCLPLPAGSGPEGKRQQVGPLCWSNPSAHTECRVQARGAGLCCFFLALMDMKR